MAVRQARPAQVDRSLKPQEPSTRVWHIRFAAGVSKGLPDALDGVIRGQAWYRWRRDSGALDVWCVEESDALNAQGVAGAQLARAERRPLWYVFEPRGGPAGAPRSQQRE